MAVTVRRDYSLNFIDDPIVDDTWETAIATRDIDGAITDWYLARIGHDPALDYASTPVGTWTVNSTWLTTNNGNGRVSFDSGTGRWLVERYYVQGLVRVAANDITFRNINQDGALGALYGAQSRAIDGNASGIIFENCTFDGNDGNANGATFNFPVATEQDQIIVRYCDVSGYRAGMYAFAGMTFEYNYAHDLYFTEGSHNTGASIRGGNVHMRRNLITDGNSAALSFYPEVGPYTNVIAHENILRLQDFDTGAECIMASDREFSPLLPGEVRELTDNLFYRGGNLGPGPGPGGSGVGGGIGSYRAFSTMSGNYDREGNLVPAA